MKKVTYIISDIDKALAFEWIAQKLNPGVINLNFILILNKPAILEQFLTEKNIPVHALYYNNKKDFPVVFLKLMVLIRKIKPETVHCHLFHASFLGLTAAWLLQVNKRIYTRHHSDLHHLYFPKGVKWDRWCNKLATKIVAPSGRVRDILANLENVPDSKIQIIHHGFALNYFLNVSAENQLQSKLDYNPKNQHPVIGVIARFTEWKGIQYIIPAFINLLANYPDAKLLLFNATGDYLVEILSLLEPVPKKNYQLVVFDNSLSACYKLFDVFVHTPVDTHVEAFGQTYVEALASGVPAVFTLSGIASDFIEHEKNALVVPFKDSDAIYLSMRRILEERGLKEKLIAEGWNSVKERFALQHMIKQLEELYEKG